MKWKGDAPALLAEKVASRASEVHPTRVTPAAASVIFASGIDPATLVKKYEAARRLRRQPYAIFPFHIATLLADLTDMEGRTSDQIYIWRWGERNETGPEPKKGGGFGGFA